MKLKDKVEVVIGCNEYTDITEVVESLPEDIIEGLPDKAFDEHGLMVGTISLVALWRPDD